jgi:glycerate dehydrogenase
MKIVNLDGNALNPGDLSWEPFQEFGDLTLYERTQTEAQVIQRIGDAQIILLNKVPITDHIMASCPNLKLICVLATGYNVIDCAAAKQRGITVCNVPDYGTASVA